MAMLQSIMKYLSHEVRKNFGLQNYGLKIYTGVAFPEAFLKN